MAESGLSLSAVVRVSFRILRLRGYAAGDFGDSTSMLSKIGTSKSR